MCSEYFYKYVLELFRDAGYTNQYNPIYINHSSEQVVYFDVEETVYLTSTQRKYIKNFNNVSYLFNIVDNIQKKIAFYSLELKNIDQRSQCACDVHDLLHSIIKVDASVLLIKYKDHLAISFYGYGQKYILSDWYNIDYDFEMLLKKIDIANISINSARDFFLDMIYSVARNYYIYPVDRESTSYNSIPINYFLNDEYDRETLKEIILNEINNELYIYGDDYVEQTQNTKADDKSIDFDKEFDLMLIDINETEDENIEENIFGDEYFNDEFEDFEREDKIDDMLNDIEESEILNDPVAMVEWLNKH